MLVRKQKTYALLDADDNDDGDVDDGGHANVRNSVDATLSPRKGVSNKKRFRKKTEAQDEDDEAVF